LKLASWLEARIPRLAKRWLTEVKARGGSWTDELEGLMEEFLHLLVSMLPPVLGPQRDLVSPIWQQASELFGSVGAMRGLASGEVIEEFHLLRDAIIRLLYADPPQGRADALSLRDVLRLNRVLDAGATHASVGHTDALFFALFQGTGAPTAVTKEITVELRDQLGAIRSELQAAVPSPIH
jgi:hypothetical protein